MFQRLSILAVVALLLGVFLVGGSVYFVAGTVGGSGPLKTVFYEVTPTSRAFGVARDLEKSGIISSARAFYWYLRLTGRGAQIKTGDYRFTNKMTPGEISAILMSGVSFGFPVTIPEGYNIFEIADVLEKLREGAGSEFLKLARDRKFVASLEVFEGWKTKPSTVEGYLFPDTYLFERRATVEEMIRAMTKKFQTVFTSELVALARQKGLTEHETVTLASIIEKETGFKKDRPLIASVFWNRLKKRMKLQTDPTVVYGVWVERGSFDGNIRRRDLDTPTPYNTYHIPGLPPGPISNPGREAIMVALNPAQSDYLFFVSRNDGTTQFSKTFGDHNKAVNEFQMNNKAREGKSWRDLKQ